MAEPSPAPGLRVAVVGGGLSGLVVADALAGAGLGAVVFERYAEPGGLVGTFETAGDRLERLYHHLFTSDADFVDLARDLGLAGEIEWLPSRMGFFRHGKTWDFGTPASLLRFSPLGLRGRLEFVLSTLALRHAGDFRAFEGETVAGWFRRRGYGRALDVVWGPLLSQKYGRRAEEVGLAWLWGKIALRSRSRDATGLGERLGYMRGSFGRVVEALSARVAARGGEFRGTRPVRVVRRDGGGFGVEFRGGTETFDLVVSTVPIPELLAICPDLPADSRARWSRVEYGHALCPVLELDRSLSPFYWTNVGDVDMPFGGVIEHTNLVPRERYGGRVLVYLSDYVLADDPKWQMRDDELWALYEPGLARFSPEWARATVHSRRIFRAEYAQPIVLPRWSEVVPPLRTGVPGLYSASMAQIYPEDRGQNYAVRLARQAAGAVLGDLSRAGTHRRS